MSDIHSSAQTGYSKASDTYQSGRPTYPKQLIHWLCDTLQINPDMTVMDLGAGTGKFTYILADTGAKIIAVEPVAEMLGKLQTAMPKVQTIQAAATKIPLDDESVDVVICAQAFHWFASAEVLAEIRRVLKPDGYLGLVWNVRNESCNWVAQLTRIMAPYEDGTPRYHEGKWRGFSRQTVFPHFRNRCSTTATQAIFKMW